jgi:16S rRNA pseudouridine516 synthase
MFHAVGKEVFYLKRLSMGSLVLDPSLAEGNWRPLTEDEVRNLKN